MRAEPRTRREILRNSSLAAGALMMRMAMPDFVFAGEGQDETPVPFMDMPPPQPQMLNWEKLDDWLTPQEQVFNVQHYGMPEVDSEKFQLEITGLVENPRNFTLEQLKALPRKDQLMTLECSGNGASKTFMGAIYNSRWTGTPLAPILKECGIKPEASEAVFFGVDRQEETLRKGTPRELTVKVPFGRSMSVSDALESNLLLAYERNGQPLEQRNGAPMRLIVPGWYGIANVKWLRRIDLRNRRYMGRFMGRDYVTVRGQRRDGEVIFVETSVARMNLKSIVARVTRRPTVDGLIPVKAYGAVWSDGTPIRNVQVRAGEGPWRASTLDTQPRSKYCWTFFSIDLGKMNPGRHKIVSRAIDVHGRVQPTAEDDEIAAKRTYWEAYAQWPRDVELQA